MAFFGGEEGEDFDEGVFDKQDSDEGDSINEILILINEMFGLLFLSLGELHPVSERTKTGSVGCSLT